MSWYKNFSVWELLIFLLSLSLFLLFVYFYFYGMSSSFTNKGIKLLKEKNFIQAQKNFHLALAEQDSNPWSYLNIALGYDLLKAPDKALKTYNIVSSHLKKKSHTALFYAYFNKGELYGRLGQIKEALQSYQQALDFKYKEKEIKTNIELLFQTDKKQSDKEQGQDNKEQGQDNKEQGQDDKEQGQDNKEQGRDNTEQGQDNKEQGQDNKEQGQDNKEQGQDNKEQQGQTDEEQQEQDDNKQQGQNDKEQQGQAGKRQNEQSDKKQKKESLSIQEKAIFEEVEKQENEAHSKNSQRKNIFGNKTKEDW